MALQYVTLQSLFMVSDRCLTITGTISEWLSWILSQQTMFSHRFAIARHVRCLTLSFFVEHSILPVEKHFTHWDLQCWNTLIELSYCTDNHAISSARAGNRHAQVFNCIKLLKWQQPQNYDQTPFRKVLHICRGKRENMRNVIQRLICVSTITSNLYKSYNINTATFHTS